jgi:hypothetical protein
MALPTIPIELKKLLMPKEKLSITEFLQLPLPPDSPPSFININSYLSADMPDSMELIHATFLQSIAIPPKKVLDAFEVLSDERAKTVHSICIPYFLMSLRFLLWIMSYWVSLSKVRKSQMRWKTATEALQRTISSSQLSIPLMVSVINVNQALSRIPWSTYLQ